MGGRESRLPRGEEGGVSIEVAGGGISTVTLRDRERFRPGENEGWDKGSYRSSD